MALLMVGLHLRLPETATQVAETRTAPALSAEPWDSLAAELSGSGFGWLDRAISSGDQGPFIGDWRPEDSNGRAELGKEGVL